MFRSLETKISKSEAPNKRKENKLVNPDIPLRDPTAKGHGIVRDRFFNDMKASSAPRNGSGYSLARSGGIPNMDPRRQEFMLEGSIDPANIRARHDPLHAPPNSYATGAEGFGYELPASTRKSHNSVDLIKQARQSLHSRINLLQPDVPPARATS